MVILHALGQSSLQYGFFNALALTFGEESRLCHRDRLGERGIFSFDKTPLHIDSCRTVRPPRMVTRQYHKHRYRHHFCPPAHIRGAGQVCFVQTRYPAAPPGAVVTCPCPLTQSGFSRDPVSTLTACRVDPSLKGMEEDCTRNGVL